MSNKKNNNNTNGQEMTKEEAKNQENIQNEQNSNVQDPPAAVPQPEKARPTMKERIDGVKAGVEEFFDKDKHPIRHAVGKGVVTVGKAAVVVGATVGVLAFMGSKSNKDDDYDENSDDQYDDVDYDDPEDEEDDPDVVDGEAKEI